MKKCSKCGIKKDKKEFYSYKKNKDGLRGQCKKCYVKYYNISWNNRNPEKIKEYISKWNNSYKGKLSRILFKKRLKEKYGLGTGTIGRYGFKVSLEVYDRAKRKCQYCGEENDLTIHHLDHKGRNYANKGLKPNNDIDNLIVLCRKCHGYIHGKESRRKEV